MKQNIHPGFLFINSHTEATQQKTHKQEVMAQDDWQEGMFISPEYYQ